MVPAEAEANVSGGETGPVKGPRLMGRGVGPGTFQDSGKEDICWNYIIILLLFENSGYQ